MTCQTLIHAHIWACPFLRVQMRENTNQTISMCVCVAFSTWDFTLKQTRQTKRGLTFWFRFCNCGILAILNVIWVSKIKGKTKYIVKLMLHLKIGFEQQFGVVTHVENKMLPFGESTFALNEREEAAIMLAVKWRVMHPINASFLLIFFRNWLGLMTRLEPY